jgi:thiaminase/transcriptional activator TenA
MTCQALLQQFPEQTNAALHHQFLEACASGSIQPAQFDTWLQQDYHFVCAFEQLAQQVLRNAPSQHVEVLASGVTALEDEQKWFKVHGLKDSNLVF